MKLSLKRPIVFFDLETTGINIANDRIVEISLLKITPEGTEECLTYRVNPERPIPAEATSVHGIYDEDVKDEPPFSEIGKKIAQFIEGSDLGGYNSNRFDIPLLAEEFLRVGIDIDLKRKNFIDVQVIFHKMEQRTLSAAYKFYCDKNLDDAHSAEADTKATYEIFKAQLDRYKDVDFKDPQGNISTPVVNDMDELAGFTSHNRNVDFIGRIVLDDKDVKVFNFGKYKGVPVETVLDKDPGYYSWIMNGDFPLYTKKVLTQIKLDKFNL